MISSARNFAKQRRITSGKHRKSNHIADNCDQHQRKCRSVAYSILHWSILLINHKTIWSNDKSFILFCLLVDYTDQLIISINTVRTELAYCTILYCTVHTVLYSTVLYSSVLYSSVLYFILLYCTVVGYTPDKKFLETKSLTHVKLWQKSNKPNDWGKYYGNTRAQQRQISQKFAD